MAGDWTEFVEEWLRDTGGSGTFDRVPLAGDASNRQYFRVQFSGAGLSTAILMQKNTVEGFKKSEEAVGGGGEGPPGDPFILIARFLRDNGIPVPAIYHLRGDGSLILQEDLGDHTLYSRLGQYPKEEVGLTERVLSLLVEFQGIDWKEGIPWLFDRRFSSDLIRWEFEHFVEYGLAGAPPETLRKIRETFDNESHFLADTGPSVLVHRDYHSRNLMVGEDGRLGLIDFQDLLQGSPFYDLASFLFDAYRNIPMDRIDHWLARYREMAVGRGILPVMMTLSHAEELLFRHAFQRNLKACGRFFYISDVKGNHSFLPSVLGTHKNLERLAGRLPVLRAALDLIGPYLRRPSEGLGM